MQDVSTHQQPQAHSEEGQDVAQDMARYEVYLCPGVAQPISGPQPHQEPLGLTEKPGSWSEASKHDRTGGLLQGEMGQHSPWNVQAVHDQLPEEAHRSDKK